MCDLLNDEVYNKIMFSEDEDYIFDNFFPILPEAIKCFEHKIDKQLILARRFFSIIDKILTMFLTDDDINELLEEKKNEILNVKSSTELVVNKLSNVNVDLNEKELIESVQIVLKYFNKLNEDQKELSKSMNNLNENLEKRTKDLQDNLDLKLISDFCKDITNKSKDEIDMEVLNNNIDKILKMIKEFDQTIIKELMNNYNVPEVSSENLDKMKAYNMITSLRILLHLKNRSDIKEEIPS
jgi:hypothetical protein